MDLMFAIVVSNWSFKRVWKFSRFVYRTLHSCFFFFFWKTCFRVCIYIYSRSIKTLYQLAVRESQNSNRHESWSVKMWSSTSWDKWLLTCQATVKIKLQSKCSLPAMQFSIFLSLQLPWTWFVLILVLIQH